MRTGCKRCKISNTINKEGEILQEIIKQGGGNLCEEGEEHEKTISGTPQA